jgi:hypothetical protein
MSLITNINLSGLHPIENVYALYELYAFYEVWQKSGKESVPRSEPVWLAENLPHGFSSVDYLRLNAVKRYRRRGPEHRFVWLIAGVSDGYCHSSKPVLAKTSSAVV